MVPIGKMISEKMEMLKLTDDGDVNDDEGNAIMPITHMTVWFKWAKTIYRDDGWWDNLTMTFDFHWTTNILTFCRDYNAPTLSHNLQDVFNVTVYGPWYDKVFYIIIPHRYKSVCD